MIRLRAPRRRGAAAFLLAGVSIWAALYPRSLSGQHALPGRIVGTVVEQRGGAPIAGAEVRIRGMPFIRVSDEEGHFSFASVPAGVRVLEVNRFGYRVRTDSILVPPEETLDIRVTLAVDPVPLDPIVVTVRSKVLEVSGFYRRKAQGLSGVFLTRDQIRARNPTGLTDLFVSIPGARVAQRDGVLGPVVVFPRGRLVGNGGRGTATCDPDIWLDGVHTSMVDLNQISPDQVEGMEVYQGAGAPLRFSTPCGAILIWTHIPEKKGRRRGG